MCCTRSARNPYACCGHGSKEPVRLRVPEGRSDGGPFSRLVAFRSGLFSIRVAARCAGAAPSHFASSIGTCRICVCSAMRECYMYISQCTGEAAAVSASVNWILAPLCGRTRGFAPSSRAWQLRVHWQRGVWPAGWLAEVLASRHGVKVPTGSSCRRDPARESGGDFDAVGGPSGTLQGGGVPSRASFVKLLWALLVSHPRPPLLPSLHSTLHGKRFIGGPFAVLSVASQGVNTSFPFVPAASVPVEC